MTNCNEINIEAGRLKSIFGKCYNLKAIDLRDVVDLIESVNSCTNGSFQLKTVNGQSLFGSGNIVVTATVDGTETKLQQGTGISITGLGSISSPYVINNSSTITVDGSETKINQGSNINIAGTGTVANPYVINAIIPASAVQVNSDWSAISGPAQILNKPSIPSAQVNSDWNSVSGPSMILNKPALSNTNLGYIASANGGQVTSSTGSFADIPLFNETNAGLMSQQVLNNISADSDNIKTEILIDMPATESNDSFAQKINQLPLFSVSANQIPIFKAVKLEGENPVVFYVELIGKGKGSYGLTGVQLSAQDVKVTSFVLSSGALELEPTTQIIELGVSAVSVLATINSSLPNIVIQDQASGYVIIKGTFNSQTYEEYLWIGAGNIYGFGATQAVLADLKRINDIVVMKAESNYSGTVKTNFTVADPVVYLKESTDQLLSLKQVNLISGTNIKTINGNSLLGSGNIILVTDISGKEDIANKSSSFTASSTVTYANTKALVDGLATKATGTGTANGINTGDNATNTQYSGLVTNSTHSGDATGATVLTLATVNANVGSFGSASIVPQYTVNAKGLTTASANVPIQIAQNQVTSLSAELASKVTTVGTTGNLQRIVGTNQLGNSALVDNGASVTSSLPFLSTGSITGNSFVKAAAATSNILLAGGADISQAALPISTATQTALDLKANLASPALTGAPTAPTPTTTTGIANKGYVDSAIVTADAGNVKLTGNQNISGVKTFNANIIFQNAGAGSLITANSNAAGSTGFTSISTGGGTANHIVLQNSSGVVFQAKENGSIISSNSVTATSFINSSAPAANVLLAGGGTLAQTGLPYLPLSGGALTGGLTAPTFNGALNGNATTASNAFSRSFKIEGSIPFLELRNTNTTTESYAIFASINETLTGYGNYLFFNAPVGKEFYFDKKATFSSSVTASLLKPTVYTVATLPTPPSTGTGTYATVSDAVAPAYLTPVMGGGTVVTPVFYNGSNWICH